MDDKFVLISLNDKKSKDIGKIMSNETAKKILDYISDHEKVSPIEISKKLSIPLNTVTYNLDLLEKEGLIEKKDFAWSDKGKKVVLYSVANKMILIVPKGYDWKKSLKSILPVLIVGTCVSLALKIWEVYVKATAVTVTQYPVLADSLRETQKLSLMDNSNIILAPTPYWFYAFLITLGVALIMFIIELYRRKRK